MKGLLLKYDGNQEKLLSEMLNFLNTHEYNFHIAFDDLASNTKDEFWDVESYTSDTVSYTHLTLPTNREV